MRHFYVLAARKNEEQPAIERFSAIWKLKSNLVYHQNQNLQFTFQLRQCAEQISHQTVVGYLEDRRFFIFVDGNDHF